MIDSRVKSFVISLPIIPLNELGPDVAPSRLLKRARNGSSFKCNRQTSRYNGLFTSSSIRRITPECFAVLTGAPSQQRAMSEVTLLRS